MAAMRQAKGISLAQISEATKIRTFYLQAIEAAQYDQLPGGVFNVSYIRQYARAIEYDEWELLACYDSTLPPEPKIVPQKHGLARAFGRVPGLRLLVG